MPSVVVLPQGVDRDAVDDAIAQTGLRLVNVVAGTTSQPRQVVAMREDGRGVVSFVDDARLAIAYALVDGAAQDELAAGLAMRLGSVTWAEVDARAGRGGADLAWAARYAVAFQDPDRAGAVIALALAHQDVLVRRVGAVAAAYCATPTVRDAARRALAAETDLQIRALLGALAEEPA